MKTNRSKACDISVAIKRKVWERDGQRCIICGNHNAMPNAHFISRANSGRGIEQNIVTLCIQCHYNYDQTDKRPQYKEFIRNYLKSKYKDWNEEKLIYKKGENYDK